MNQTRKQNKLFGEIDFELQIAEGFENIYRLSINGLGQYNITANLFNEINGYKNEVGSSSLLIDYTWRILCLVSEDRSRGRRRRLMFGIGEEKPNKYDGFVFLNEISINLELPQLFSERVMGFLINIYQENKENPFTTMHLSEKEGYKAYVKTNREIGLIIDYLESSGDLKVVGANALGRGFILTIEGCIKIESAIYGKDSKAVFVIMEFKDSDLLYDSIVQAVSSCGFRPIRVDKHEYEGGIPDQIIKLTKEAIYCICELSKKNVNVYYEMGYALGLGKTVIPICEKKRFRRSRIGFDIAHLNMILYEDHNDLNKRLSTRINALNSL